MSNERCHDSDIIITLGRRLAYLLSDTREYHEKCCVESGKEDRDDNERHVANDRRSVGERIQSGGAVISKRVEPSLHLATAAADSN